MAGFHYCITTRPGRTYLDRRNGRVQIVLNWRTLRARDSACFPCSTAHATYGSTRSMRWQQRSFHGVDEFGQLVEKEYSRHGWVRPNAQRADAAWVSAAAFVARSDAG